MRIILFILYFSLINAYDEEYYEEAEAEVEGIICSTDKECPKHHPKCRKNHCQAECISNIDCGSGKTCLNYKCVSKKIVTKERYRGDKNGEAEYEEYEEAEPIPPGFEEPEFERDPESELEPKESELESESESESESKAKPESESKPEPESTNDKKSKNTEIEYRETSYEVDSGISSDIDPDDVSYADEHYEDEKVKNKSLIEEYDEVIDSKTLGNVPRMYVFVRDKDYL